MFGGDQQPHPDQRWCDGLRTAARFHLLHGMPLHAEDDQDLSFG